MSNANTTITITSAAISGPGAVALGYSNGSGNVDETEGQGTATVTYVLDASVAAAGWSIVGLVPVTQPAPVDITWQVTTTAGGNTLVITDTATAADSLDFLIQLMQGGQVYSSADPIINNEPD